MPGKQYERTVDFLTYLLADSPGDVAGGVDTRAWIVLELIYPAGMVLAAPNLRRNRRCARPACRGRPVVRSTCVF
ncbi:hypothetical protein Psuf_021740 [Phytohabitans suffuscus]|uniref:Uncharacterized protein n=1 Tax=Phytohabitans suffuscus TaxID=624315 RepID=A0A6F8YFZ1_9ACTN|nr:hypothetical protein Psuf_021740 [Phytohabitans suffuscus]